MAAIDDSPGNGDSGRPQAGGDPGFAEDDAAPTSLHAGDDVADVEVTELLASGSATETWRARRTDGSEVIVQSLRPGMSNLAKDYFLASAADASSALRERPLPSLPGPVGVDPAAGAFVIDLAALGTVADVPVLRWTTEQLIDFMRQLCFGLQALHGNGRVHGCLEPETILLDGSLRPVLSNAGLVDIAAISRESPDMTPLYRAYAAPEVLRGEEAKARADVFSAGRVLHFALTGEKPNEPDEPTPRLESLAAAPPGLVRIVRKCTSSDPMLRYVDAGALLRDLDRYTRDEPCGAPHPDFDDLDRYTASGGAPTEANAGKRPRPSLRPRATARPATSPSRKNAAARTDVAAHGRRRAGGGPLAWSRRKALVFAVAGIGAVAGATFASLGAGMAPLAWQIVALMGGVLLGLAIPGIGPNKRLSRLLAVCVAMAVVGHVDPTGIAAARRGSRLGSGGSVEERVARLQARRASGERQFPRTDLASADLSGADLSHVTLDGSSLRGARCQGTNLTDASLLNVDLTDAEIAGAQLSTAIPEFVVGWRTAKCDDKTVLPDGWTCSEGHPAPAK